MNESIKVILVIARGDCASRLVQRLLDAQFRVTEFASMGGFLRQKNTTLILGVKPERVDEALSIVRDTCATSPDSAEHNATLFVLDSEQFIHF